MNNDGCGPKKGEVLDSAVGSLECIEDEVDACMGFSGFGKINNEAKNYKRIIEKSRVELPCVEAVKRLQVPTSVAAPRRSSDSDTESSSDEEENAPGEQDADYSVNPELRIPMKNSLLIRHGAKLVSGITIDNGGTRLVSVGFDFNLNMYDFATMDSNMKPFRTFEPLESHRLRSVKHSPASDLFMVVGSNCQIKLCDRDGKTVADCIKGDQYLVDMLKTKGHVAAVNGGAWNPTNVDMFASCSMDCTARIWSVETCDASCVKVLKARSANGKNIAVVDCVFNHAGNLLYTSCMDGSIQLWDHKKSHGVPVTVLRKAHTPDSPAYSLCINRADQTLVSRGLDDSLKVWDVRKLTQPVFSLTSLPNSHDTTRVVFSQDNRMVITGTSERKGQVNSSLNFYKVSDFSLARSIPFEDTSPINVVWHSKLNQVFVSCSDGTIRVFFDPEKSLKGVLLCIPKVHEYKVDIGESMIGEQVITPYARQQEGREMTNVSMRKLQIKARKDPVLTKKPEPPVYGPGQGGRLTTGMSLSAFVCKQMVMSAPSDESNPREAILKYADLAEEDPYFVTPAYKKTQPQRIFQDFESDEGEDDTSAKKVKKN